jgi:hypothetical protein
MHISEATQWRAILDSTTVSLVYFWQGFTSLFKVMKEDLGALPKIGGSQSIGACKNDVVHNSPVRVALAPFMEPEA